MKYYIDHIVSFNRNKMLLDKHSSINKPYYSDGLVAIYEPNSRYTFSLRAIKGYSHPDPSTYILHTIMGDITFIDEYETENYENFFKELCDFIC
jgi:hypothetical protein